LTEFLSEKSINFEDYWSDIDEKFNELLREGFVKFPSIANLDLSQIDQLISSQVSNKTYTELGDEHRKFIEKILLDKYLVPKLFDFAKREFGYKGLISNQYHIARCAIPGDQKYRAHFDSHIFTLVIPIRIPELQDEAGTIGELVFFPNARSFPKNSFIDFIGKLWFRQYSSKAGMERLSRKKSININSFNDYEPLLFLGNTVFHSNQPISSDVDNHRLTLLAHYFDPFPSTSVGSLLRRIRFR
jgi:hypothetical protein